MRKIWLTLSLVVVSSWQVRLGRRTRSGQIGAVAASDEQKPPPPPAAPPADAAPASANRKAPPPPPAAPTPDGRNRKVGPNVKVEVMFSEQRSDTPATPKTVTITTNDGQWGRVRSSVNTPGYGASPLNVDARPEVLADGRVLLSVNIEYGEKRVPAGKDVQPGPDHRSDSQRVGDVAARKRQGPGGDAVGRPHERPQGVGGGQGDDLEELMIADCRLQITAQ